MHNLKNNPLFISLSVLSVGLYVFIAYFIERSDFTLLLLSYSFLFFVTYQLIKTSANHFWLVAGLGVLFRLVFMGSIPVLSQDFYRFIWDGRLVFQGVNPYLFTPEAFVKDASSFLPITLFEAQDLYQGMGALNGSHYSNYPPVNQFFFAIAALFSGKSILGSVVVMRLILILSDIGILYFGRKLLLNLGKKPEKIFWYFLNPFVIIEMTGNLHFESVMLFFLVWSLYLLYNRKWLFSAILFGLSVSVKLLPLLLLPFVFQWFYSSKLKQKNSLKLLGFYAITLVTVAVTFMPFYSPEFVLNFTKTIALWFQNFEFNASVYYLIRWIGYQTIGWNVIATAGKILPVLVLLFIVLLTFFRNNKQFKAMITAMLFGVSFYFLLSTTVHPWYVATPLLLSVFTRYRFPVVWSFMIILSYSAYGITGFSENLGLVAVEYLVVIAFFVWELKSHNPHLRQ